MRIDVVSIFPAYLDALDLSLIGKAQAQGIVDLRVHDLRAHGRGRHRAVDDAPFGGGAGMVMQPEPWARALTEVLGSADERSGPSPLLLVPGPSGAPFTQAMAHELADRPWLAFACGRYEGIDERVYEWAATRAEVRVVSLGDYVLNGGEVAVLAMVEAIARLLPGVVGNAASLVEESHEDGLLEQPVYTRPATWTDPDGAVREVPPVLLGGDHAAVDRWRREQRLLRTAGRRPDLLPASALAGLISRDEGAKADVLADLDPATALPADAPEIAVLQRACWAEMVAAPGSWWGAPAETAEQVRADLERWTTWTWRSDGRLVASVRCRRDPADPLTWQIGRLMVVPDLQGRGIGRALLAHAEALAPAGVERLWLTTGADQPRLLRMYRRAGYRVAGPGAGPGTVDLVRPARRPDPARPDPR